MHDMVIGIALLINAAPAGVCTYSQEEFRQKRSWAKMEGKGVFTLERNLFCFGKLFKNSEKGVYLGIALNECVITMLKRTSQVLEK